MKSRKLSQVTLLVGLVLGFSALWAGATPVVGVGPEGVGGWQQMIIDGVWVAVSLDNGQCTYCWGTYSASCSSYDNTNPEPCRGADITVAICSASSSAGSTTHAAEGPTPCWSWSNLECNDVFDAACY